MGVTMRSRKRSAATRPSRAEPGRTTPTPAKRDVGRLPHERDESSDSQRPDDPHPEMVQAHEDVARGLEDTSRGEASDPAYRKLRR